MAKGIVLLILLVMSLVSFTRIAILLDRANLIAMPKPINCPMVVLRRDCAKRRKSFPRSFGVFSLILIPIIAMPVMAETTGPLFDAAGYRVTHYRAPVPNTAPRARTVTAPEVETLQQQGALVIDVTGINHFKINEKGEWISAARHESLPGAHWLPVVGWGRLTAWQQAYLQDSLRVLSDGDFEKPIVVLCKVDCWLSWNTARRLSELGYRNINWFPGGTDAWLDEGLWLDDIAPYPVSQLPIE